MSLTPRHRDLAETLLGDWGPPALLSIVIAALWLHDAPPPAGTIPWLVGLLAPLVVRRRYPVAVFVTVAVMASLQWVLAAAEFATRGGGRLAADLALLLALYTVASRCRARTTVAAALVMEVGVAMEVIRDDQNMSSVLLFALLSGMVTAAGVLGVYARTRAAYLNELHERAERLERERDQQAALAVAAERARIAREMHDIVAHHLAVMIALSAGAAATVGTSPERAVTAMNAVASTGREALADTRRLLGVLREPAEAAQRAPQPDLDRLDSLLAQVRSAGLPLELVVTGTPGCLPAGLQLTVYRVIQEALTNTLKHASPGARAVVTLTYDPTVVGVQIVDDGSATPRATDPVSGHGITGMRERVLAWGGDFQCGPTRPRGWRVSAKLTRNAMSDGVDR